MSAQDSWGDLEYSRKLETFDSNSDAAAFAAGPAGEVEGICLPGELTDHGRATTRQLGERLRHLYVDQLKFMPAVLENDGLKTSTSALRPYLSFYGFYPPTSRAPGLLTPKIITRTPSDETLYPNEGACRRFAQLSHAFAQRTADRWNESEDMAYLNKLIGKWMPEGSNQVKVDGHPRLSGIMDTINSTLAHGEETKLPKEFYDPRGRDIVDRIGVEEWYSGYKESAEYRALGIGGLIGDVVARMVDRARFEMGSSKPASGTQDVRFALSGCHDTTLAAVLSSMGAFENEKWPPYTSHIAIELFQDRSASSSSSSPATTVSGGTTSWWTSIFGPAKNIVTPPASSRQPFTDLSEAQKKTLDGYYVRLRYNDRVMTVPGCKPTGKHYGDDESLCTLEAFKQVADKFTPKNWKQACNANLGANAFPEKVEPAGV
ncbi:hypothetical protein H2203_002592 [Taxawa tesnikishii (nom. ined.)]|nr:hypothetical protein H2203_002592 [Dothideales sp. JES 119]